MGVLNIEKNGVGFFTDAEANTFSIAENVPFRGVFPVGAIYMTTNASMNPADYFGGTWVQIAQGRILVSVDTSNSLFNTPEKTGGVYKHSLTTSQMPAHTHNLIYQPDITHGDSTNIRPISATSTDYAEGFESSPAGSGTAHENTMPYIVCKIWKCTWMYSEVEELEEG